MLLCVQRGVDIHPSKEHKEEVEPHQPPIHSAIFEFRTGHTSLSLYRYIHHKVALHNALFQLRP